MSKKVHEVLEVHPLVMRLWGLWGKVYEVHKVHLATSRPLSEALTDLMLKIIPCATEEFSLREGSQN